MKVSLENITKKFDSLVAVDDFTATLQDGKLICLLGPSGCGKSTLLNMLCGITKVTSGKIMFDDVDVTSLPPDQRNIGMVFQNYALYPHLKVIENIAFPLEVKKIPKKERLEKALEIAKLVHVDNLIERHPSELSGGQQQRVAIARALIKNPKLLLMDEPLSNLDARLRLELREEIKRIQKETGVTTIFVTHDQEEAMAISDSIFLMKDGKLVQQGKCQDLYSNPNCKFVADFLGNPPINQIKTDTQTVKTLLKQSEQNELNENKEIFLSVRAESFNVQLQDIHSSTGSKTITSEIKNIYDMGKDRILNFNFLGTDVRAIVNNDINFSIGDKIDVGLKERGVFIFDSENEKRLV